MLNGYKNNCDQIIGKQVFTICYDYERKAAKYVAYTLDGSLVNKTNIEKRASFYTEKNLAKIYRSHSKDYEYSGYDRGHLASDASFDYDKKVVRKTYSMANIVPMTPSVNRKSWFKAEKLECIFHNILPPVSQKAFHFFNLQTSMYNCGVIEK